MNAIVDILVKFSDWIWGYPMLVLLVGGGVIITIRLNFFQFTHLGYILKETFGKMFKKGDGEGTVTAFQAAVAALASTIGASNIVGVPVAIATGGPGAIFWMWLTALVGCATKFAEISLAVKYRVKEGDVYVGGPMYYLRHSKIPVLGVLFAFFLMVELVPSISTQALSFVQTAETIKIPPYVAAAILAVCVALVVFGGIRKIASFTEKLVPLMAVIYLIGGVIIIALNIGRLPGAFALIFKNAFTPTAAVGGFAGAAVAAGIRNGMSRGAYSNEAGMGTSSIAHASAVTDHPGRQGLWGTFEIFVDTIIVCTITGLVLLVTDMWTKIGIDKAASMPSEAFKSVFGQNIGGGVVTLSILMFVLSTVIVVTYYGERQAAFLFGKKFSIFMRFVYIGAIFAGVTINLGILYKLLDLMLACLIIPNMIGVLMMMGEVVEIKKDFFAKEHLNR
ncbi:MAG: amino acid carrier protein [Tissierellia bacterium]|nr:amino acid carrier protein [Tissierellia bacterium]